MGRCIPATSFGCSLDALTSTPCYNLGAVEGYEVEEMDKGSRDEARRRVDVEMEDADDEDQEEVVAETYPWVLDD